MRPQKHIMIVDDDQQFSEQFEEMLNLSGYKTDKYSNGDDFLNDLDKQKPDLVMLDLRMEGKSGFEIAEILHKNPQTKKIPVIAMSAFYKNGNCNQLTEEYGVRSCLSKPIKPLDVIAEIEMI